MLIRLQKYIADQGICSRRKAEILIAEGKVKVNGEVMKEMGVKVDSDKDKVVVSGAESHTLGASVSSEKPKAKSKIYIALNKPVDFITSASSEQGESVMDLITLENFWKPYKPEVNFRVYPVGRLDKDSEGLVLLTNDGDLTNKLTHPSFGHEKEYEATLTDKLTKDVKKILESGMDIGEGEFAQGIKIVREFNKGKRIIITIILKEGKNRQIRRMFGRLGYDLLSLRRTRIGKFKLGTLPTGRWKFIKKQDIV